MSARVVAPSLRAEDCTVIESRAALAQLSGARITSVEIARESPELPGLAGRLGPLHHASTDATIRRQLLFVPGDTIDTLLVGETLRRRLFSNAVVVARCCDGIGPVAITLRSRDTWSLRPTARLRTPSQLSVGLEERNLFGTACSASLTSEVSMDYLRTSPPSGV